MTEIRIIQSSRMSKPRPRGVSASKITSCRRARQDGSGDWPGRVADGVDLDHTVDVVALDLPRDAGKRHPVVGDDDGEIDAHHGCRRHFRVGHHVGAVAGEADHVALRLDPGPLDAEAIGVEAEVGDHVLIHAGFAIGTVNAEEAAQTLELLREFSDSMVEL